MVVEQLTSGPWNNFILLTYLGMVVEGNGHIFGYFVRHNLLNLASGIVELLQSIGTHRLGFFFFLWRRFRSRH